jgi:hypothetical protein
MVSGGTVSGGNNLDNARCPMNMPSGAPLNQAKWCPFNVDALNTCLVFLLVNPALFIQQKKYLKCI